MQDTEKKYRINEFLNRLSVTDNRKAINFLPRQLGISVATFNNYRNIDVDSAQDIPHIIVVKLEKFFSLSPRALENTAYFFRIQSEMRPLSEIDDKDTLASKYHLEKI
jgi:hypothetical protein